MYFVHGNPARKSFHETKSMLNVVMYDSALRHCGSSLNHLSLHHLWIAIRLRHVVSIDNTRCGRAAQYFSRLDLSLEQLHPVAISLLMKAGVINIAVQDFVHHPCVVVGG